MKHKTFHTTCRDRNCFFHIHAIQLHVLLCVDCSSPVGSVIYSMATAPFELLLSLSIVFLISVESIDATSDLCMAKMVNDDWREPNCKVKKETVDGKPHLLLFAIRDILPGQELRYDYGKEDAPWRMVSFKNMQLI